LEGIGAFRRVGRERIRVVRRDARLAVADLRVGRAQQAERLFVAGVQHDLLQLAAVVVAEEGHGDGGGAPLPVGQLVVELGGFQHGIRDDGVGVSGTGHGQGQFVATLLRDKRGRKTKPRIRQADGHIKPNKQASRDRALTTETNVAAFSEFRLASSLFAAATNIWFVSLVTTDEPSSSSSLAATNKRSTMFRLHRRATHL
jgi:hypothetical protein